MRLRELPPDCEAWGVLNLAEFDMQADFGARHPRQVFLLLAGNAELADPDLEVVVEQRAGGCSWYWWRVERYGLTELPPARLSGERGQLLDRYRDWQARPWEHEYKLLPLYRLGPKLEGGHRA